MRREDGEVGRGMKGRDEGEKGGWEEGGGETLKGEMRRWKRGREEDGRGRLEKHGAYRGD